MFETEGAFERQGLMEARDSYVCRRVDEGGGGLFALTLILAVILALHRGTPVESIFGKVK